MLNLVDVEYTVGERTLFSRVNANINPQDRFGLVGANGTGKTTLLRITTGEIFPTAGAVHKSKGLTIGYLPQEEIVLHGKTLIDEVLKDYNFQIQKLSTIEKKLKIEPYSKDIMKEYEIAHENFQRIGGYDYETDAQKVLFGLGFIKEDYKRPVQEFSSGWQMRIVLARLLLNKPELLLLDEPTNHLDIESIEWLENYLQNFKGAMVIVSHDRYFLDKILQTKKGTSGIWEIDFGVFRRYRTNYTNYLQESHERKQRLIQLAKNQEKRIAEIKEFIARNKANKSKAGVVKSREKYLERMAIVKVESERKKIRVHFPVEDVHSLRIIDLKDINKVYNNKKIFEGLNLSIETGNKIALIGKNGAGKSTLCRIIADLEEPTCGVRRASEKLKIGTFSHEIMGQLDPANTVLEEVAKDALPEVNQHLRSFLGLFLFSGDDVFKKISVLSGGEKTRLVMLKTMIKPSNLLILDEPTYHLDKDSVESIKQAIKSYSGTVIFVTHDRDLIADFANRIIELKNNRLYDYPGDYNYYSWKRENRNNVGQGLSLAKDYRPSEKPTKESEEEKIKRQILTKEAKRNKLRDTFSRPGLINSPRKAKKLFEEYQRLAEEIEELEKRLSEL